ncbi:hypothetical protein OROHE_022517 [Orobanche hederae]
MRNMSWSKLRLSSGRKGCSGEGEVSRRKGKSNVSEEYNEAFRTKSYTELCSKVEDELETRTCPDEGEYFSEYLLEPPQETVTSILENSELHHFLISYFDSSQEAGRICESVLQNIHQVGINHRTIKNITKLVDQFPDSKRWTGTQYDTLYRNLASFATHNNPFSSTSQKILELHDSYVRLLHQLTSKYRKTKRRTKFIKYIKRGVATFLTVGSGALAITLLILAANSMVGMVAAPGLIVCCLGFLMMKKLKGQKRKVKKTGLEGQLDVAARGVYTLINDFDTMGQLVKQLYNEMERRKYVAETCVEKGKNEMVKEVVRDFHVHESCFLEEVEELKKHIYLSFLNINRARRLLVQEIV